MNFELEKKWRDTVKDISQNFGEELDLQSILFLIGLQELNKGHQKLNKQKKLDVMHIAICVLLEPAGYYNFTGRDEDGWPHFDNVKKMPHLNEAEQELMMKEAIIEYFQKPMVE